MHNFLRYFALLIAALFILCGIIILFTNIISSRLPEQFRIIMGIVLILYGIFRIVVTLSKKKDIEI